MVWWIVLGLVVAGVLLFVFTVASLPGRLRPLSRAVRRLRLRAEQAQHLQHKVAAVQEKAARLEQALAEASARAERLSARRAGPVD